jgi:hypothetical protein
MITDAPIPPAAAMPKATTVAHSQAPPVERMASAATVAPMYEDARDTGDRKRNVLARHEGSPRRVWHISELFGGNVRCAQLLPYRISIGEDVDVCSVEPRQPQSLSRRFERFA